MKLTKNVSGREYKNGTSFCEAQNFEVVDGGNCFKYDPKVFGTGFKATMNFLQQMMYILLGMLMVVILLN